MLVPSSNSIPLFIFIVYSTILLRAPNVTADELVHVPIVAVKHQLVLQRCGSDDSNYSSGYSYTSGSQYETNLNLLLRSLVSGGSGGNGFFNTSKGVAPDIVYGLAQCRADLSTEDCRSCLTEAAGSVPESCPNTLSATFRYERCLLHYSNNSTFSKDHGTWVANHEGGNLPDDRTDANVVNFLQQLRFLLYNLSETAAPRPTRYSFGATSYAPFKTVRGMVECRRDLSPSDCTSCLQDMISLIPTCCNAVVAATIISETCFIQYDLDPPSVSPPTMAPPSNGTNGGKYLNILFIVYVIISTIMLELY